MISQNLAQFGVLRSCASGDIMHLICQVTSQDHLIERSSGLVGESSSKYVTTLAKFGDHRHSKSGDVFNLSHNFT